MMLRNHRLWVHYGVLSALLPVIIMWPAVLPCQAVEGSTPPVSLSESQRGEIQSRAYKAVAENRLTEAAALFESIAAAKKIAIQDDAGTLVQAAKYYLKAGNYDKVPALCEQILAIPAAPGAHPPAMMPGPVDLRGEAYWILAEVRRHQGRWKEALEIYRTNREKYPRSDGCVFSGGAGQDMALAEAICLENLGRYDESVKLLWPAAVQVDGSVPPLALHHLINLYASAGRLSVIENALTRESRNYEIKVRSLDTGRVEKNVSPEREGWYAEQIAASFGPLSKKLISLRQSSTKEQWEQSHAERGSYFLTAPYEFPRMKSYILLPTSLPSVIGASGH